MARTKKIILFIVEGLTDKESLGFVLSKLMGEEEVFFGITRGDITSRFAGSNGNIKTRLWEHIKEFLNRNRFQKSDIKQIVHLIDTDGAFISDAAIKKSKDGSLVYHDEFIETRNVEKMKQRNHLKKDSVYQLQVTSKLGGIPYEIYYLSRNLEHVLHGISKDLSDEKKIEYADQFIDQYEDHPEQLVDFLNQNELLPIKSYKESWNYIYEEEHSLKRKSNLGLYFRNLK